MILVVILCIAGTPDCETHRLPMPGAGEVTCLIQAQAEAARLWRPGLNVVRIGCERRDD